ncbi:MAG: 30S ribosomal protein S12 methylthiotransferase RimO [Deltaproteobacteria bacterium]|nr:30S ribosomal protein S12 methylthiotransferase RimO [Deltaproteobacteria bacterium]MCB9787399.1 30S ribosomal protein S12 methylthiotransferase RimO [Deltaproteobacteria bacterium]
MELTDPPASPAERGGKVFFVSLGCPKNRVDSEIMLGELAARQYEVIDNAEEADLLVVNTCSFVEEAREESVDTILELARAKTESGDRKKLVVAGCLAQRYEADLTREIPEVDLFLGTGDHWRIGQILGAGGGAEAATPAEVAPRSVVGRPGYNYDAYSPRLLTTPAWSAYVKIAEGCSQVCAFCIIPRLRGGQKSRPIDDIVQEARLLAAGGAVELNLIAQDLTHYGDERKDAASLEALLRELVKIDGVRWIRLLYCYPHGFSDGLVELIATEPKIAKYVDMPLQHIAQPMLERMRRRFSEDDTRRLVEKLRRDVPELTFRTTFIVGHPGETDEEFQTLYDFVAESRFERVGVFKYSREDGTRSARMDGQVMGIIKDERYHRLMTLQQGISSELHQAMVGRTVDVLVEGVSAETDLLLQGRTQGQAPDIDGVTYINEGFAPAGSLVRAEIVEAGDYDLVARIV